MFSLSDPLHMLLQEKALQCICWLHSFCIDDQIRAEIRYTAIGTYPFYIPCTYGFCGAHLRFYKNDFVGLILVFFLVFLGFISMNSYFLKEQWFTHFPLLITPFLLLMCYQKYLHFSILVFLFLVVIQMKWLLYKVQEHFDNSTN